MTTEHLKTLAKQRIAASRRPHVDVIHVWMATEDDVCLGDQYSYCPACHAGDLMARVTGRGRDEVSWDLNLGPIEEETEK